MEREDIKKKAINIIEDKLCNGDEVITENTNLNYDIGADSLDQIETIMEFEKEFNILIPDEEGIKLFVVKDIIDYIYKKVNN